jgi:hypothetical protein
VLVMGLALTAPAFAQTVLFGPKQYTRTAGPPNQFTDTFTLPRKARRCSTSYNMSLQSLELFAYFSWDSIAFNFCSSTKSKRTVFITSFSV